MHVLTNKLRKEVKEVPTQNGSMFVVEMAEVTKDFKTGEKAYTNYKAKLFTKTPEHAAFLRENLVVGSVVTIAAEKLVTDLYLGGQTPRVTMDMDNPRLQSVHKPEGQQPQQTQQQGFGNQQQRPPQNELRQIELAAIGRLFCVFHIYSLVSQITRKSPTFFYHCLSGFREPLFSPYFY
jgi:hypothetical protein